MTPPVFARRLGSTWALLLVLGAMGCDAEGDSEGADAGTHSGACAAPTVFYPDSDGDGLGDARSPVEACEAPGGFVDNGDDTEPDCATNDTDSCGVCGGDGPRLWYADFDGDGLGDGDQGLQACEQPEGYVSIGGDPQPDCTGNMGRTFYADDDGDELGDPAVSVVDCQAPEGYVDNANDPEPDCVSNDSDVCGVCAGPGPSTFFADLDGDGLGDAALALDACAAPAGFVDNADDVDPACGTNDTDTCGVCAGPGAPTFYADQDGDGAGDAAISVVACAQPAGFVAAAGDIEPLCATDDTDECGICAGANASKDCLGVCGGAAFQDGCNLCAGGTSGRAPAIADWDNDQRPDLCDQCPAEPVERIVIQWTELASFNNAGGPYTFQAILHANGDFVFQYEVIEPLANSASFGHQGEAGANGVSLGVDSAYPRDHRAVFFRANAEEGGRTEVDYTVPKVWIDIRDSGRALPLDDDGTVEIALPWAFPYNGVAHDSIVVGANGIVSLSGAVPNHQNRALGAEDLGAFLAPFWDDLNPEVSGTVSIQMLGAECAQDCDGMFGGVAFEDACGVCVGGTSGRRADDSIDCNGDCNGQAYSDICGQCVGGQTGRAPSVPEDCISGPDLIVDEPYLRRTVGLEYLDSNDPCLVEERCLTGLGHRKIIRFGTQIANLGNEDLRLGRPAEGVDHWYYDQCHGHYHYEAYASYDLVDLASGEVLPIGSKSGFSVIDIAVYDPEIAVNGCVGYSSRDQGITAGCQDTYSRNLQCQWIDVTGIPDGEYEVRITTNPQGDIYELNYDNNSAGVRVRMTGDDLEILDP